LAAKYGMSPKILIDEFCKSPKFKEAVDAGSQAILQNKSKKDIRKAISAVLRPEKPNKLIPNLKICKRCPKQIYPKSLNMPNDKFKRQLRITKCQQFHREVPDECPFLLEQTVNQKKGKR